jgi:hypothetical protein
MGQQSDSGQEHERTWSFVDKSAWPTHGDWLNEPDKVQWIDQATGLDCLIHRGPSGALCGYVGVPPGHKFHGEGYDGVRFLNSDGEEDYPDVHGGLTFADACSETVREDGGGICHVPYPGRPADVWWLGFDCAHAVDFCPKRDEDGDYGVYRNLAYVRQQVASLAKQLAEAA